MITSHSCSPGLSLVLTTALLSTGCQSVTGREARLPASPLDHGGAEIGAAGPVAVRPREAPVVYRLPFQSERELWGYNPRFMPTSAVAFGLNNRPFIRASRPDRDAGDGTEDGFIQTLGSTGRWGAHSITDILGHELNASQVSIATGVRAYDTRVVCDNVGDLYALVRVLEPVKGWFLLHRPADSGTWSVYELAMGGRLERTDPYRGGQRPPMIVGHADGRLALTCLEKTTDGTLTIGEAIRFAPGGSGLNPAHSGAGPVAATVGDMTYLVCAGTQPVRKNDVPTNGAPFRSPKLAEAEAGPHHPGTPQYVVCYDHPTGMVTDPVLLGFGQNPYTPKPDNHNGPAIVADSRGLLHVVLGAHQHNFWYVRAMKPNPQGKRDWSNPEPLGFRRRYDCGLTYVALVIDSRDRLHLVARNVSRGHDRDGNPLPADEMNADSMMRTLDYFRGSRQADGSWKWEEKGALVMPLWHRRYSIFYHKLAIDRKDRLFLTYSYFGAQLSDEATVVYREKWPGEKIPDPPLKGMWMRPHDPAILMSSDGGDTWRLALTQDFAAGASGTSFGR
mgnify:FL=1